MKKYNVIFKTKLKIEEEQIIELPYKSRILTVQTQDNAPVMWFEFEHGTLLKENRKIFLRPTGHIFLEEGNNIYISTVQQGMLVWHFYDGGEV